MKRTFRLRLAIGSSLLLFLVAWVGVSQADAAERVRFKNGHQLVVQSVEEQGDSVALKLEDGSIVTFPMALIEEIEVGKGKFARRSKANQGTSGRGLDVRSTPAYERLRTQAGGKIIASVGEQYDGPRTMGYSRYGSGVGGQARSEAARDQFSPVEMRRRKMQQKKLQVGMGQVDGKMPTAPGFRDRGPTASAMQIVPHNSVGTTAKKRQKQKADTATSTDTKNKDK